MEFALDKEIADAKKLVGRGDTRFGSEEKLLEDLFDKESTFRKLTESRKMAEITRKEREDTLSELETAKEYASRLADSRRKSKTASERMIDDSIKILRSKDLTKINDNFGYDPRIPALGRGSFGQVLKGIN